MVAHLGRSAKDQPGRGGENVAPAWCPPQVQRTRAHHQPEHCVGTRALVVVDGLSHVLAGIALTQKCISA
jgi:hypothetical protein